MSNIKFTERQILRILQESDAGAPLSRLCKKYGMSTSSFYSWRGKYADGGESLTDKVKTLEGENRRLRKLCLSLQRDAKSLQKALA